MTPPKPDAIEILVSHQAAALVRHGAPLDKAREEAIGIVDMVLTDLCRLGMQDVYLGVALRRAKVYRLKCQGVHLKAICERLEICPTQAKKDYRSELMRRHGEGIRTGTE